MDGVHKDIIVYIKRILNLVRAYDGADNKDFRILYLSKLIELIVTNTKIKAKTLHQEMPVIRNEDHYNQLKKEVTMARKKKKKKNVKKKKKR